MGRLLIGVAIAFALFVSVFVYFGRALNDSGIIVQATVTKMRWYKSHEPQIWVTYQAPGEEPVSHHFDDISPELFQSLAVGGPLPLRVVPGLVVLHPDSSGDGYGIYVFYGFAGLVAILGFGVRRSARDRAERALRTMENGVLVEGKVNRLYQEEGGDGWMLAYRYRGADGQIRKGESGPHRLRDLTGLEPDQPINVLADPEDITYTLWVDAPDQVGRGWSRCVSFASD
ncbi:MAG: hypothetical protein AAGC57_21965 [Pseudomonadota bacterium]